jgi:hypothetical protein
MVGTPPGCWALPVAGRARITKKTSFEAKDFAFIFNSGGTASIALVDD